MTRHIEHQTVQRRSQDKLHHGLVRRMLSRVEQSMLKKIRASTSRAEGTDTHDHHTINCMGGRTNGQKTGDLPAKSDTHDTSHHTHHTSNSAT